MTNYAPLTDEEITILAREYYNRFGAVTEEQETPTIMLIGGQPGAGKSFAVNAVTPNLFQKGGVIYIDADAFHDDIKDSKNEQYTATETHTDCKKIAMLVRDYAFENKRNILEEGLFRHHDSLSSIVERAHQTGYKCEIIVMAVSREQSRLSVLERREIFRDTYGYLRDIPENKQDMAYEGFIENILKDANKLDRLRVMNRACELLYDSAGDGLYKDIIEALEKGQRLTDEHVATLTHQWEALQNICAGKGIPSDELTRVDEGIMLFRRYQSSERHRHGMRTLEQNYQALAADARYGSHAETELRKAAFYRGVLEKKQAFEGKTPNLHGIDTILMDRETLYGLPDIDEIESLKPAPFAPTVLSSEQYWQQRHAVAREAANAMREAFWGASENLIVLRAQIESCAAERGLEPVTALDNVFCGDDPAFADALRAARATPEAHGKAEMLSRALKRLARLEETDATPKKQSPSPTPTP
ncbi:MAG: zeta toxin family protein [Betaproteobacteria bacterium]|nr:zeta toxin family protein [Betaproteobacteria bacterium]